MCFAILFRYGARVIGCAQSSALCCDKFIGSFINMNKLIFLLLLKGLRRGFADRLTSDLIYWLLPQREPLAQPILLFLDSWSFCIFLDWGPCQHWTLCWWFLVIFMVCVYFGEAKSSTTFFWTPFLCCEVHSMVHQDMMMVSTSLKRKKWKNVVSLEWNGRSSDLGCDPANKTGKTAVWGANLWGVSCCVS